MEKPAPVWIRWAPVAMALLTGAALVASVVAAWIGIRAAAGALAQGQGDIFLRAARDSMREPPGMPSLSGLEAFVAENSADGLRFAAFVDDAGTVLIEAGSRSALPVPPRSSGPGHDDMVEIGSRRRIVVSGPPRMPPPPPPMHAPPGFAPPPGPPPRPPMPATPRLVIEFEPLLSQRLLDDGRRTLIVGGTAAVLFVVFAVFLGRALRQREKLERRLARERRLAALGEMSAVLAHEIRNPLASLKGHAQLLLESMPAASRERDKVDRVVREAVRLETLTNDLLDFVRSGAIERRPIDPVELLRTCVEDAGADRFNLDVAAAPKEWPLDPARMRQAIANVLRNALQASPDGEKVEVGASERDGRLVIVVRDRGPGIRPGDEETIFEAFHTTKVRGTGLGLAVARQVIGRHGGTIEASGRPDGGAEFRMALPKG